MDIWVSDEIRWEGARVDGEGPFNAARFGLYCFFGSIVAGELLYLLIKMVRHGKHGRKFAFFNFLIAVLICLIVQFITLAIAMWFAYLPWRENIPVCIASYTSPVMFAQMVARLPLISRWGLACSLQFGILWLWQK